MTITELCQRFGVSRETVHSWRKRGIMPPPHGGRTKSAYYGRTHVEAIEAHLRLQHNNVSTAAAVAFCAEAGITLRQYVDGREQAVRDFGIGIA